jgi:uncharacterized iron-regulated protein
MYRKALAECLVVFLILCLAAVPALSAHFVFKVKSGGTLDMDTLVAELKEADIVTVGEQHDNRQHHAAQLSVIRALHEADIPVAIGFEMFGTRSQEQLDAWVAGRSSEKEFFKVYSRDWQINLYPLYRDIFLYAREHRLTMLGLNVDREVVSQVAGEGFASLSEEQRGKIRVASCNIDQEYQEVLARVIGQKGGSDALFTRFCEAQVVWDTAMAINAIEYAEAHPDTLVVILAGNFHAWNRGIPHQVQLRTDGKLKTRAILPASDTSFFNYEVVTRDADYVWWFE